MTWSVTTTPIHGVMLLRAPVARDERGYFTRLWCRKALQAASLTSELSHCAISSNSRRGTLRGMHYQVAPCEEVKVVHCLKGAAYDVVLDLRADSPTFRQWHAVELTLDDHVGIYIPRGCAHGFQTLTDDTLMAYWISADYDASLARGVRWNDPGFGIRWPLVPTILSARDAGYPDHEPA